MVRVVDPNGEGVGIVVGLAKDQHGRYHRALGIGDGPSAFLTDEAITDLKYNLDRSEFDLDRAEGRR
ncbi:hypothetical protein [Amycolatopsis lurida]|uniref:hypothetical protein n=1 Tax=Amycolatopsis lurida TaxID=31959 RepID=UPI00364FAEC2